MSGVRLTVVQRTVLERLAAGRCIVDDDYVTHLVPGRPSRLERTLAILADRRLIDWSEGVAEIVITEAGRAALKGPRA